MCWTYIRPMCASHLLIEELKSVGKLKIANIMLSLSFIFRLHYASASICYFCCENRQMLNVYYYMCIH